VTEHPPSTTETAVARVAVSSLAGARDAVAAASDMARRRDGAGGGRPHGVAGPGGISSAAGLWHDSTLAWDAGARVVVLPTVPYGVQTGQIDQGLVRLARQVAHQAGFGDGGSGPRNQERGNQGFEHRRPPPSRYSSRTQWPATRVTKGRSIQAARDAR